MWFQCLLALALVPAVNAQSSTTTTITPKTLKTPSAHVVYVGSGNGDQFVPDNITANPGDTIIFTFAAQGHSVVQSAFGTPCIPFNTEPEHRGEATFFSGFFNGTDTLGDNPPTWNLTINTTEPTFFYCSRLDSCIVHHMMGVINANETYSLEKQAAFITNTTIMLQPGEPLPQEAISSSSSTSSSTSSATETLKHHHHDSTTLSTGATIGIAIAGLAVLGLACALFWFIGRHRTLTTTKSINKWMDSTTTSSVTGGGPPRYSFPPGISNSETSETWKGQQDGFTGFADEGTRRFGNSPLHVQELGVSEVAELSDTEDIARSRLGLLHGSRGGRTGPVYEVE